MISSLAQARLPAPFLPPPPSPPTRPPPSLPATYAQIEVELTPEGLRNRFKVLTTVFSYLDLIRKQGMPSYLAPELQALSELGWRFQDKREPGGLVSTLVASMQEYEPELAVR